MSELFSPEFVNAAKSIFRKPGTIFLTLASLTFWVVLFAPIRAELNSVLNYFGWKFEWYSFLEGFSQLWLVQIFFMITCIISVINILISPIVDGYLGNIFPAAWLIFSIILLILGNVSSDFWIPFCILSLISLVIVVLFCLIKYINGESLFLERMSVGIFMILIFPFFPLIVLWNFIQGR